MELGTKHVTQAVVDFILSARIESFPEEAVRLGKRCIGDGIGVMLAGSTTPASAMVRDHVKAIGGTPEATVLGPEPLTVPTRFAGLANGAAGHALDFDDTQLSVSPERIFGLLTHPTIPPLAAALALGERHATSGKQLLEAFLVGFEVECKIAEAIDPAHYKQGFHSSGTIGTFGAAVAAAKLLKLPRAAVVNALGIAASSCSGIRVNFGTMTKPLHVGRAAENGLVAADLAARRYTAAPESLDGPWGFFPVFGFRGAADGESIVRGLGAPHTIVSPGVSVKPFPCGVLGHPSMEAMLKLVVDHDVKPDQIKQVRLRAASNILNPLRYRRATNELEAKFCPAFMLSSIAIRRKAGIHEFTDEFVTSEPVQRMMDRVETVLDAAIEAKGFDRIRSIVEVDLHDGRHLVQEADERYRGGPERPLTDGELFEKFAECGGLFLGDTQLQTVWEHVFALDRLQDVRALVQALSPA